MNYLAHLYLSENKTPIQIGNFIADPIKGNSYLSYPKEIQKGILLHRQIDWFTDTHITVKQSKKRLDSRYGHYKGIIIDIFYDHFLAKNWKKYSKIPLQEFNQNFYRTLESHLDLLPEKIKKMIPYITKEDWLTSYASLKGVEKVLVGMNKRTQEKSQMHLAINDLKEHYEAFEKDFTFFFEKLRNFSATKHQEINTNYTLK